MLQIKIFGEGEGRNIIFARALSVGGRPAAVKDMRRPFSDAPRGRGVSQREVYRPVIKRPGKTSPLRFYLSRALL